jgi:hypothetical protein
MRCAARILFWVLIALVWLLASGVRAQQDEYLSKDLIPNGDFQLDADADGYPDGWPRAANATLGTEQGNRYLSLSPSGGPSFELPLDPGWTWVRVACRMRCRGIRMGPEGWHDARMVMSFNDANHQHMDPWPDVLRGEGTFDWRPMERTFRIPPGAAFLSIGPANFAAEGTVDFDDVAIQGKRRPPLWDLPLPIGADTVWDMAKAWRLKSATQEEVCLSGAWQFRPATTPGELSAVPQGPGWGYSKVPGSWCGDRSLEVRPAEAWEDADLDGLNAAWYRRQFTCPADWQGRKIELRFDLVQSRANVFIDGQPAGDVLWPGGAVDVTGLCRPGQRQELAVLALALPLSAETQTFMGPDRVFTSEARLAYRGLCGDVFLKAVPPNGAIGRIEDVFVQPSVEHEELGLDVALALAEAGRFRLQGRVEHEGHAVKEFTSGAFSAADLKDGRFAFSVPVSDPPLWDVDRPQFCTLHLALSDAAGKVLDEALPVRFGFRDFRIKGRDLYLNGKRIHLRALFVTSAANADAGSFEGARNTFRRMKRYGFNFCIMHNYSFGPGEVSYFLDMIRAADEEGMLLSFSLPHVKDYGWSLEDAARLASYRAVTAWCIGQVRHHPSVVLYAMNHNSMGYTGDQNPAELDGLHGPDTQGRRQGLIAQQVAESLDPTRPVYHHQSGNLGSFITLNCYLNWAPIRERSRWLSVWATQGTKPFFFVEWGLPHISSWSSYRGPEFIWSSPALQQAWTHEFAATFKGNAAYEVDADDVECLKTELGFWERNQPFGWWNLSGILGRKETNVIEIKALYASKNWPAHRTWGVSAMLPWDQEDMWRHRKASSRDEFPLETDWANLHGPGISPDRAVGGASYLYSRYPEEDWEPTSLGRTFMRVNMPLLAYLGGKGEDFTEEGHNFTPGETVRKQVILINDTRRDVRCSYRWGMDGGPSGEGRVAVEPGGIRKEPFAFRLADDLRPGSYRLSLAVTFDDGQTQQDEMAIHMLSPVSQAPIAQRIALYDPAGRTRRALANLGVRFTEVGTAGDLSGYGLLVVGREALSLDGAAPNIARVRDGLNVLVFEQKEAVLHRRLGFRTQVYGLRQVFPRVPDHPILAGLSADNLRDWRGDATLYPPYMEEPGGYDSYPMVEWCGFVNSRVWRCGTGGNVATALIEKPARGDFLPIVDGGFDLQYAPILEYAEGKGRVVFCQMDVTGRTEQDPAARTLVRNLLSYCAGTAAEPLRTTYYAGAAAGRDALARLGVSAAEPAGARLGPGDVLVLGPGAPAPAYEQARGAAENGCNVLLLANDEAGLANAPVRCRWQRKTVVNSPLRQPLRETAFRGLSNAETHFRNFKDLPALAEVPAADREGLLAAAEVGKGKVAFCQVAPWMFDPAAFAHDQTTYRRTAFLLGRMLANLGSAMDTPLLANWDEPAAAMPDLRSGWRGVADPDDLGLKHGWQEAGFDDSGWPAINVPGTWESQRPELQEYNGIFWYRTKFDLPVLPQGAGLWLVMGAVDDEDWTHLNGQLIGSITAQTHPEQHWAVERRYPIPRELLRASGNVLAVRVNDTYLGGGIVKGPVAIVSSIPGRWLDGYYADKPAADDDPYRYYRW